MKLSTLGAMALLCLTLAACKEASENKEMAVADVELSTDSQSNDAADSKNQITSSEKTMDAAALKMPERKFLREASLSFDVKQVEPATYSIEKIVKQKGGFIENTELQRVVENENVVLYSKDSATKTSKFHVENTMVIRVPDENLDSTLSEINGLIAKLHTRNISATDVSITMLSNNLHNQNLANQNNRINRNLNSTGINNRTMENEEFLQRNENDATDIAIENLRLQDRVNYSSISLSISEPSSFEQSIIVNPNLIHNTKTPFGLQVQNAFVTGWNLLKEIFVLLMYIWPLVLCAILFVIFRKKIFVQPRVRTA